MANDSNRRQLTQEQATRFDGAEEKLITFHADVEKLSNKKPDGALNAFKLGFINQVLATINPILGDEYQPFPDFSTFDVEGSIPSASDVVMMLSQYRKAMVKFRQDHQKTVKSTVEGLEGYGIGPIEHSSIVWNLSDTDSAEDVTSQRDTEGEA